MRVWAQLRLAGVGVLLSLVVGTDLLACTCEGPQIGFLTLADQMPVVAEVRVVRGEGAGLVRTEVMRVFKGGVLPKQVSVQGDNGKSCLGSLTGLVPDSVWVVALQLPRVAGEAFESPLCPVVWMLRVAGDKATGVLHDQDVAARREATLGLADFEKRLR